MDKTQFKEAAAWESKMDELTSGVARAQAAAQAHLRTCKHWITENQPDPPKGGYDVVCVFCKKVIS